MELHPLRGRPDACAVIERQPRTSQWGGNCRRPPTVRAVWRFDTPGPRRILLCDGHAAELTGHERLTIEYR